MHEYDSTLKTFLTRGRVSLRGLTPVAIDRWHNIELPVVRGLRVDLLGESVDGRLVHIELQSTHDANMALRMMEYCTAVYRQFSRFPEQVVLYVGEAPLRMTGRISGPSFSFDCRIVDIRQLDGERLLASDQIEDNVIAVLAKTGNLRDTVKRILARIAACDSRERERALAGFLVLAGLRRLGKVIRQEVSQMPILDDIMDHEVLGPEIKRGLALGREQGREEGIEQGRHDGELAMLLRLIEKRFGPAPAAARGRLAKMSVSEVEEVALRLLEARSLEELLG